MLKRTLAVAAGAMAMAGALASAASARTFYVSTTGHNNKSCSAAKPCGSIAYAVGKAHRGDTVTVEPGSYKGGDILINRDIRVVGVGEPTLDSAGKATNGFLISGPNAAGAVLSGFAVQGANQEGILAQNTSYVTISNNIVRYNDLGMFSSKPTGECAAHGPIPGDCGEGIHLLHVSYSSVDGNHVYRNAGGILLTDETGPTSFNTISGNHVNRNLYDCGITLAGHNSNAVATSGKSGGIYWNTISGNTVNENGTLGQGGGILMATGAPGGGVWFNTVRDNTARRNGLAGVVIHAHAPGEVLNGNRIIANVLTHNGLADTSESEFGENDGTHNVTVDILIGSDVVMLHGIVVRGNLLGHAHYGVFTKNDAKKVHRRKNFFRNVVVKVRQT